jgi:hypothetical protein
MDEAQRTSPIDSAEGINPTPARVTTVLPPPVAVLLRGALYAELGRACEDAPATVPECNTRAGWTPFLSRISSALDGLRAIGWVEPDSQEPVTIVLDAALIEVLETDAEQWEWTSEQDRIESDEGRALAAEHAATIDRFLESLTERPTQSRLMIPVSAFSLLREGAGEAICDVAQAIDAGADPRECARKLTAISDLLDLIDGDEDEPTGEVDATADACTVAELAALMLPVLMRHVADLADTDPTKATTAADLSLMRRLLLDTSGTRTQTGDA